MSHYQKTYTQFFLSKRGAPLAAIPLVFIGTTVVASCSHAWTSYDPRIDEGSSSAISSSSSITSSSSTSSGGAMGGSGGTNVGGMGGAGGMGGMGGMGGAGGGVLLCEPGSTKSCYSGAAGTENIGACKSGATICEADGMSYGPCLGQMTPIVEECSTTAVDDDCNGAVNDHCGLWAIRAGMALEQRTNAVATDSAGNVAITGYIHGSADFGGGVLTSAGGKDIFVAAYDKNGTHLFSKVFGGAMDDEGLGVVVDSTGIVVITGYFAGSMMVDVDTVTSVDGQDAFAIALKPTGAIRGYVTMGGLTDQRANAIAVDKADNFVVTGTFATEIDAGLGKLMAVDMLDGFLMKYDSMGNALWQKSFGGTGDDQGVSVTTNTINDVFLTGTFDETLNFGGAVITDGGGIDVFVAKFDTSGNHVLSKGFPALQDQYVDSIAIDISSNLFLFGEFDSTINMGGGPIASAGGNDLFATKLDASGNHVFTKTYGDAGTQAARALTVDKSGDIVFTAEHEGTVNYGGGPVSNAGNAGTSDVIVVKLKGTTGAHVWSRKFGNASDQDSRCITTDLLGNIFVGGEFSGMMNFGAATITANSSDDAFIVKLAP